MGCTAVPNVTARPSTASEPITVLLYDGPLLCGFNVAITVLSIVTVEHYIEVGAADSAVAFRSSPRRPPPPERFLVSNKNIFLFKY